VIEEFHYRIPWRTNNAHPGRHASSQSGSEQEFYSHMPLMSRPEARNIDVHASLLDPFGQFMVRTYRQRSNINVNLIADLSASMNFQNKMQLLADFCQSLAISAYRSGDHFGFFGCNEQLLENFHYPNRWYKGGLPELATKLHSYHPDGVNCYGIQNSPEFLPRQRSLTFLVSDFHFPKKELSNILDKLIKHDVIPIILWHPLEYQQLPEWGLFRYQDSETGQSRHLFMRPSLKAKIKAQFDYRRQLLQHLFSRYGRQPFFITDHFNPDQMTRYFYEQ